MPGAGGEERSWGSWQRHHPEYKYVFWNDSLKSPRAEEGNPNMEPFVKKHFPFFLPSWKLLWYNFNLLPSSLPRSSLSPPPVLYSPTPIPCPVLLLAQFSPLPFLLLLPFAPTS